MFKYILHAILHLTCVVAHVTAVLVLECGRIGAIHLQRLLSPEIFEVRPRFHVVCACKPILTCTLILSCLFDYCKEIGVESTVGHDMAGERGKSEDIVESVDKYLLPFVWRPAVE